MWQSEGFYSVITKESDPDLFYAWGSDPVCTGGSDQDPFNTWGLDPFYTGVEVGSVLYWEWKLDLIYAWGFDPAFNGGSDPDPFYVWGSDAVYTGKFGSGSYSCLRGGSGFYCGVGYVPVLCWRVSFSLYSRVCGSSPVYWRVGSLTCLSVG